MVIKFNPQGRVVMVLGRRPEAGRRHAAGRTAAAEPYTFNRPTDVAWDAAGNIFVSDGYGNSRVVKYDKNGRFIKAVGTQGIGAGAAQSAAHHRHGRQGERLCRRPQQQPHSGVRQRPRIQGDLRPGGRAVGACASRRARTSISTAPIRIPTTTTRSIAAVTGEIYKMELDGTMLGKFGQAGQEAGRIQHGARDRLPQRERIAGLRDHRVARAEADAASEQIGGRNETSSLFSHCAAVAALAAAREIAYDSAPNF